MRHPGPLGFCPVVLTCHLSPVTCDLYDSRRMIDEARRPPPDPHADAELVAACLTGDRDAFHRLTLRYYRPVCGYLLRRTGQPDLVEDLAQETFLEAFRALQTGTRPTQLASWLFGIAHNRC